MEVFYCLDIDTSDRSILNDSNNLLSHQRRIKVSQYKFLRDQILSTAAYMLLLYSLKDKNIIKKIVNDGFSYGKYGKPYLPSNPYCFFNISHCRSGVACAISRRNVGVDIQDTIKYNHNIAKRLCTVDEFHYIENSTCPDSAFTSIWSRKESFCKWNGDGITEKLRETNVIMHSLSRYSIYSERQHNIWISACTDSDTFFSNKFENISIKKLMNFIINMQEEIHEN